jgi:hypothetical protein
MLHGFKKSSTNVFGIQIPTIPIELEQNIHSPDDTNIKLMTNSLQAQEAGTAQWLSVGFWSRRSTVRILAWEKENDYSIYFFSRQGFDPWNGLDR